MARDELRIVAIVSTDPSDLYFANQLARRIELAGILVEHQRDPPDPRSRRLAGLLTQPRELLARLAGFVAGGWHRWVARRLLDVQSSNFGEDGRVCGASLLKAPLLAHRPAVC